MMKTAIIFYSLSGNTKRICLFLKEKIEAKNNGVELIELKLKEKNISVFKHALSARLRQTPLLEDVDCDVNKYDFVVFASPVWAFTFTPALRSYLQNVKSMENKKCACFLSCGHPHSSGGALGELEDVLKNKGAEVVFSAYVRGKDIFIKDYNAYLEEIFGKFCDSF